jgi:hypothetical protein
MDLFNGECEHVTSDEMRAIAKNLIDNAPESNLCEMIKYLKKISECTLSDVYDFEIYKLNQDSIKALQESERPKDLPKFNNVEELLRIC